MFTLTIYVQKAKKLENKDMSVNHHPVSFNQSIAQEKPKSAKNNNSQKQKQNESGGN